MLVDRPEVVALLNSVERCLRWCSLSMVHLMSNDSAVVGVGLEDSSFRVVTNESRRSDETSRLRFDGCVCCIRLDQVAIHKRDD